MGTRREFLTTTAAAAIGAAVSVARADAAPPERPEANRVREDRDVAEEDATRQFRRYAARAAFAQSVPPPGA